jgi:hypothetical protein
LAPVDGSSTPQTVIDNSSTADFSYPYIAYAALHADGSPPSLAAYNIDTKEVKVLGVLPDVGNLALGSSTVYVTGNQGVDAVDIRSGVPGEEPAPTNSELVVATLLGN